MLNTRQSYQHDCQSVSESGLTIAAIVPLYNGARYIEQALRSALAQSCPPDEIIVVDDGSTDDGPQRVAALARFHPVTLLRKPNGGQSAARNFGVQFASSNLIAFLDQDDVWYPDHLAVLARPFQRARNPGLGWVYSDLDEIDETGSMICRNLLTTLGTSHPKRDIFECLRSDMYVLPSASLISRQAFDAVGGFDERLVGYEDDDLFLRMFRAGYPNIFLRRALSQWRIHPSSASYSPRMARSRAIFARKLLSAFPDDPRRNRYYTRDLIAPRFLGLMYGAFRAALQLGDAQAIDATLCDMAMLMPGCGKSLRLKFRLLRLAVSLRTGQRVARALLT